MPRVGRIAGSDRRWFSQLVNSSFGAQAMQAAVYGDVDEQHARIGRHGREPYRRKASASERRWVLGLLFGGGTTLFLGLGGISSVQGLRDNGVTTTAQIVDVTHIKGATTYSLRYTLPDATEVTCTTEDVLGDPARGDSVRVIYDSEFPDVDCQSADYGTDFAMPIIFTAARAAMLAASVGGYFFMRRTVA